MVYERAKLGSCSGQHGISVGIVKLIAFRILNRGGLGGVGCGKGQEQGRDWRVGAEEVNRVT